MIKIYDLNLLYAQALKSNLSFAALDTIKKLIKAELKKQKIDQSVYIKLQDSDFSLCFYDAFFKNN